MAEITVDDKPFVQQIATGADDTINLNPQRQYTIVHLGKNAAGGASTNNIFFHTAGGTVVADFTSAVNKLILLDGKVVPVPPGTAQITAKATTAVTSVMILPGADNPLSLTR